MSFMISGFIDEISKDFEDQLKVAHELGMHQVCLRSIGKLNICDVPLNEIKTMVLPLLQDYQLEVACLGTPFGKVFIDDQQAILDQKKKYSQVKDIAKLLGCSYIRVFSYYLPSGTSPDYWREAVLENLREMVQEFSREGITVLHENEKDIYGDSSLHCLDLLNTIDNRYFRAIFDFANFVQCQEDPLEAYELLKPYIEDFHIKDAYQKGGKNVLCGTGAGKIDQIIKRALMEKKDYFATLEPHLVLFDILSQLERKSVTEILGDTGFKTGKDGFVAQYNAFSSIVEKAFLEGSLQ
ncbi:sugar phosphate isomerase/epimerase [uncultured Sphaerochaeta sp.]|uniref:sugar phosphate isomerase/epimerase family protein n=1 Tax=uncultured Sphaerochaeta sp. TaxID=886478 RepID=UPI002A0A272C|nr:sugar phosphate isomerase/epimerase [uncultured Sphaerochaeta sp.]